MIKTKWKPSLKQLVEILVSGHTLIGEMYPDDFMYDAIRLSLEYEGICDLLISAAKERNIVEKAKDIATIAELIEDCKWKPAGVDIYQFCRCGNNTTSYKGEF